MRTIKNIKKRLANTTEGSWKYKPHDNFKLLYAEAPSGENLPKEIPDERVVLGVSEWLDISKQDIRFIVNAKEDIEFLLNIIEELTEEK